jgi:hypothetical protein
MKGSKWKADEREYLKSVEFMVNGAAGTDFKAQ